MSGTLYSGEADSRVGFFRYLNKIERQHRNLLPSWWNAEHKTKCVKFGLTDEWSNLAGAVERADVIEYFGEDRFPMRLRMFAESVYGSGPDGRSGTPIRTMVVLSEEGQLAATGMDFVNINLAQARG